MSEQSALSAKNTVFIDNDRVRVSEWRFAPGTETGHHRHAHDYVVVPMTDGELTITDTDGETHTLSKELERGPVILAFFPKAFTPG